LKKHKLNKVEQVIRRNDIYIFSFMNISVDWS